MMSQNLQAFEDSSEEKEEAPDEQELDGPSFDPIEFVIGEYNDYNDSEERAGI